MIRAIVFDIGEVLVDFNWESYTERLGFSPMATDRVKEATVMNKLWQEQDRGDYDLDDLIRLHSMADDGIERELRTFFENIEGIVKERDYAAPLLHYLKDGGYQIYLLSNYGKYAFQKASADFQFMEFTDGKVISYEVNSGKPEQKMYRELLKRYHLSADSCVFLDDRVENIETGRKLGFQTIHFKNIKQAIKALEEHGIDMHEFRL